MINYPESAPKVRLRSMRLAAAVAAAGLVAAAAAGVAHAEPSGGTEGNQGNECKGPSCSSTLNTYAEPSGGTEGNQGNECKGPSCSSTLNTHAEPSGGTEGNQGCKWPSCSSTPKDAWWPAVCTIGGNCQTRTASPTCVAGALCPQGPCQTAACNIPPPVVPAFAPWVGSAAGPPGVSAPPVIPPIPPDSLG
jgi:hypothetical protein